MDTTPVGIHDNFFELGGDSILSIQVISRAMRTGLVITYAQLFKYQTIAQLVPHLGHVSTIRAEQGEVTGPLPLTPIQHRFFEQNGSMHYNQSLLFEVPAGMNANRLERAVAALLAHHDALRLRFPLVEGLREQVNAPFEEAVPFGVIDLTGIPDGYRKPVLESAATGIQAGLGFELGPLMRVALFRLGEETGRDRLLMVIHHLAVDGVSWRILLEDLQTAYARLWRDESPPFPHKTTSFKEWAHRLAEYARSETAIAETEYWLNPARFETTPLPSDHPDAPNSVASAATVSASMNEEETRILLKEVSPVYNTRINDLLLAALARTFSAWTGTGTLLVDV